MSLITVLLSETLLSGAQDFFGTLREEIAEKSKRKLGFTLGLSAGVTSFPSAVSDPERLLEVADLAMYQTKRRGKDQLFHPSVDVV